MEELPPAVWPEDPDEDQQPQQGEEVLDAKRKTRHEINSQAPQPSKCDQVQPPLPNHAVKPPPRTGAGDREHFCDPDGAGCGSVCDIQLSPFS